MVTNVNSLWVGRSKHHGPIPSRGGDFSPVKCSYQSWGPTSLLFGILEFPFPSAKPPMHVADHLVLSNAQDKMYDPTPLLTHITSQLAEGHYMYLYKCSPSPLCAVRHLLS